MKDLFFQTEKSIKSKKELGFFLTHKKRYQFILRKIIAFAQGRKLTILDLGCYPDHVFKILKNLGFEVFGASSEHEPIKKENVVVLNIEKEKLPFSDQKFDLILFSEIIEHLNIDPEIYFKEIRRVLKPNGRLLLITPNAANLKNRVRLLLGKNIFFPLFQLYETKSDYQAIYHRHNREFTLKELEEVLKRSRFKIVSNQFFNTFRPLRKRLEPESIAVRLGKLIAYFLTQFFPLLKDSIFIEAEVL